MTSNQPKYITYKGAKYERVSTLSEIKVDPIPPLTIQNIELASNQHTGDAFAALGVNYNVTLSNKKIVQADDDELLGRYAEKVPKITQGRKSPKELTDLLKGKLWDKDY